MWTLGLQELNCMKIRVELKKTSSFHFQELNWKGEWILFIIVIIIISIIIIIIVVIVIIQKVKI